MINTGYLKYITREQQEQCYLSMLNDIYYFYYGVRPSENEYIVCLNDIKYDLSRTNLEIKTF